MGCSHSIEEQRHQCVICLDEHDASVGGLYTIGSPCKHFVCKPCLRQYVLAYNNDLPKADYSIIPCPCPGCLIRYASYDLLPLVLDEAEQQAWWRKAIITSHMDSIGHCPYPDCKGIFELFPEVEEAESKLKPISLLLLLFRSKWGGGSSTEKDRPSCYATCFDCQRDICLDCELSAHYDEGNCPNQRLGGWQRQKETFSSKAFSELCRVAQSEGWARCPHCMHLVMKTDGCNTISCRCGKNFCYRCCSPSSGHRCSRGCHLLSNTRVNLMRRETLEQVTHNR